MLIMAWGRSYKLPYIIVRPTNNYGIGQYVEKLIPKTCKFLTVGKKIDLHNNGTPVRTWLHASDTAQAIITIIEAGVVNEIYNISGPYQTENINVVEKILKLYKLSGDTEEYITHMERQGQDVRYSIDDSKLRALGWKPNADFDQELNVIVKYYKNNFIW
jgi:dTDP-glucose 4,6-dehydratase